MREDLIGKIFNRLTIIGPFERRGKNGYLIYGLCLCQCGKRKMIKLTHVTSGNCKSCGCLHQDNLVKRNTSHGLTRTRIYECWVNMRARCKYESTEQAYDNYGLRGISVCDRWNSFENFLVDMGECPEGYELDR